MTENFWVWIWSQSFWEHGDICGRGGLGAEMLLAPTNWVLSPTNLHVMHIHGNKQPDPILPGYTMTQQAGEPSSLAWVLM